MSQLQAKKRVVITGIGMMTPLGLSLDETWANIMQNKSALKIISAQSHPYLTYPIAGSELPEEVYSEDFIAEFRVKHSNSSFFAQANYSFIQALQQAKLLNQNRKIIDSIPKDRIGLEVASNYFYIDQLPEIAACTGDEITRSIAFGLPHALALEYEIEGRVFSNTMTCASSLRNMGTAMELIQDGAQDIVIVGSHDYSSKGVSSAFMAELNHHGTVLETPTRSLRPFDKNAKGVASADAGGFYVIESLESAEKRGAEPLAEIKGQGHNRISNELLPLSQEGFLASVHQGFQMAGWDVKDLDAIVTHGAGVPHGTLQEAEFYRVLLGSNMDQIQKKTYKQAKDVSAADIHPSSIISLKGYLGHANICNGLIESAILIKCMHENLACGSYGLEDPIDPDLNFTLENQHQKRQVKRGIKVGLGFGGINNIICLEKI